jgi:hypothetical protein
MAALLVGVGLYGVLATVVRQRAAELGVRMALGASPSTILRLVVGHGLGLSAAGLAVGLAAAFVLTQGMTPMLVGVKPTDPLTFAVMVAVFLGDRRGVVVAARAPRGGTGPDVGTTRLVKCGWRRDIGGNRVEVTFDFEVARDERAFGSPQAR